jgi:hypothetical protein
MLACLAATLLQSSAGIGGMAPVAQPDVSLWTVLAFAVLNPAVIAVAYLLGRQADQPAKLVVAAFVAALAGVALIWLGAFLRLALFASPARAAAGIFVAAFVFGLAVAALGFMIAGRGAAPPSPGNNGAHGPGRGSGT